MSCDLDKKGQKIISLIYYSFSSFVRQDYQNLSKHFHVIKVNYRRPNDVLDIVKAVYKSDVSFSWFAGGHAFLAVLFSKILGKKSIIVVGGYDVACVPVINYGLFTQAWHKRLMTKLALKYADKVLVVDPSLTEDAIRNAKISGNNFEYLPTGYDYEMFYPEGTKKDIALTVCMCEDCSRAKIKGIDTFVKAANCLPEIKFLVVGLAGDALERLQKIAPSNAELMGPKSQDDLISLYQEAKIFCQLSLREGLPNALCEAMLCECVPIGTERNGIPKAIGDTGFYVPLGDPDATAKAVAKALRQPEELGRRARKRIIELFPMERREKGLVRAINDVTGGWKIK